MGFSWGWVAYCLAWLIAATLWSLAAASGAGLSPADTFDEGLVTMAIAGTMGVAVWRLTARVAWNPNELRFWCAHAAGIGAYAAVYSSWFVWPEVVRGEIMTAVRAIRTSPFTLWNVLIGCWLYSIVAGVSYAVRAHRRAGAEALAAAEARASARQAQLAALRAQVNPHFLFNALHTVGALVSSDPGGADAALERLGDLLRYTLSEDDEVPLEREWTFTSNYLAFEQLRLGDRLKWTLDAAPAALDVMVPVLVLQPVVENAVRHAIAPRPEGGLVAVSARIDDGRLVLHVADDGPGMTPPRSGGLGLKSVGKRLEARYGRDAAVVVENGAARGLSVTITVPAVSPGKSAA